MEFDSSLKEIFKDREGFDNFNKTYSGRWFGTIMDDSGHEYLMLMDNRYKYGYRKCIVPLTALHFLNLTKPKRGNHIKVKIECNAINDILYVHMKWFIHDIGYKVDYKLYIHPKSIEQIKCFPIK